MARRPRSKGVRLGVLALALASAGGVLLTGEAARSIGALCNGQPASDPSLDASFQGGPAHMRGTHHDDVIIGSMSGDSIDGRGGDDIICGRGGGDDLRGGRGDDILYGGPGGDTIHGEDGDDLGFGGDDNDNLYGGRGEDDLAGGADSDVVVGNDDHHDEDDLDGETCLPGPEDSC